MGKVLIFACCVIISLCAIVSGCNTTGCTELRSAVPRAEFYSSSSLSTISVDSVQISGIGAPGDSILYGPPERLSTIYLPMPAQTNSVRWRFAYVQKALAAFNIADTVTIDFDRTPWFAGEECGAMYKYRITNLAYTRNIIDSIALPDSMVVNVEKTNLAIYFRTN